MNFYRTHYTHSYSISCFHDQLSHFIGYVSLCAIRHRTNVQNIIKYQTRNFLFKILRQFLTNLFLEKGTFFWYLVKTGGDQIHPIRKLFLTFMIPITNKVSFSKWALSKNVIWNGMNRPQVSSNNGLLNLKNVQGIKLNLLKLIQWNI